MIINWVLTIDYGGIGDCIFDTFSIKVLSIVLLSWEIYRNARWFETIIDFLSFTIVANVIKDDKFNHAIKFDIS